MSVPSGEVLVAPDVEAIAVAYLAPLVAPATVATRIPAQRPARFVRVLTTGGAGRSSVVLHRVSLTVEAWATDAVAASNLARLLDGLLLAWPGQAGARVYAVQPFGSPANLPDPVSGSPRYTATYEVTVRAVAPAPVPAE